jgi:hypothetical protein
VSRPTFTALLVLATGTLTACGGSQGHVGSGADGGATGDSGTDGGGSGADSSAGDSSATDSGAGDGPSWAPPSPAACSPACSGGEVCVAGACACPVYQSLCNGQCIPTVGDPGNCGGCGVTCSASEVCSAGKCAATCLPGLTACAGQCVDTNTDNANCGACNTPCGATEGCVWGTCGPATVKTSATCSNGGPIPTITVGSETVCLDQLGASTFLTWGACTCGNFATDADNVVVDAYDSTKGPYTGPSAPGGNVGVNGGVNVNNPMSVSGTLRVAGTSQLSLETRGLTVGGDLHVGPAAMVSSEGQTTVGGDAYAAGGIEASDPFTITGALHQPAGATNSMNVTYGSLVPGAVQVPPPCACGAADVVPIASLVAHAQATNDDNAIGLNPDLFGNSGQTGRLDLPCGTYYLSSIEQPSEVVIAVHGRVALYVGGDIATQIAFAVDPTAELDVFASGQLSINQPVVFGSPDHPALVRVFIAGGINVDAPLTVSGFLYAPNAAYDLNEATTVFGGLFVGDFGARDVSVHYDRALVAPGPSCAH